MPTTTRDRNTTQAIRDIDERIRALHQHVTQWHTGKRVHVTPIQCRTRIDALLDTRHNLTHPEETP